jgi:hypothetical protein
MAVARLGDMADRTQAASLGSPCQSTGSIAILHFGDATEPA